MERPQPALIPKTPGIYIYKDSEARIIYVGKARNLRKRVLSYFRDASALTPKTVAMIGHAATLETLSTTTEKEALLLESSLIKKHRPRYNIVLRDDKQYVLFRIGRETLYPRLEIVRQAKKDGARYFGPFTS
ncbi:MAG: GIY-YIG nuclease family protein, partial [Bilophila sp.]